MKPLVQGTPYWRAFHAAAALPDPDAAVAAGAQADVAVIGAGFTGLSAALTLAEAGVRVTVLEAGGLEEAASVRNGGMIGSPHAYGAGDSLKKYGEARAARLFAEGREAYEWSAAQAEHAGADFKRWGRLRLAWTPEHFETLKAEAEVLKGRFGYDVELLGEAELSQEIGTHRYFGGLLHPDHGGLNPQKFHDGVLARALDAGARLAVDTPITGLSGKRGAYRLATPRGEIAAADVIVAANGFTPPFLAPIHAGVFEVPSFIIVTAPLPPGLAERLAPGRRMMVESRRRHGYFRLTPDGTRVLYGGRAAVHGVDLETAKHRLRRLMAQTWPELADHPIEHVWSGRLGFTFARHPHAGEKDGLHFALGYSGNGVALSPWLGRKAALQVLGRPEGATAFSETDFSTRPWRSLMTPRTMALASWAQHWIDWRENRAAARGGKTS